mgnify:CR=1 FL=1
MPALTAQHNPGDGGVLIDKGVELLRHAKGKYPGNLNAFAIRTEAQRILTCTGIFKGGWAYDDKPFWRQGPERGGNAKGGEGQTECYHAIGNDGPNAGKTAGLLSGGAQHADHLPDKDKAMPQNDEEDGRHQGVGAVGDKGGQRISVGKQDEGAQPDQVDHQRIDKRMLPLPVIPNIAQPIFPLKVQILLPRYNFITVSNSAMRFVWRMNCAYHLTGIDRHFE